MRLEGGSAGHPPPVDNSGVGIGSQGVTMTGGWGHHDPTPGVTVSGGWGHHDPLTLIRTLSRTLNQSLSVSKADGEKKKTVDKEQKMKLCTYQDCGEPSETSRCPEHAYPEPAKLSRRERGYDEAWTKLSKRARELQPWCSACGATDDLTGDHLRWPARTLKDVDVLCRSCNAKKGKPDPDNDRRNPGGMTLNGSAPHPGGKAFLLTQSLVQSGGARG